MNISVKKEMVSHLKTSHGICNSKTLSFHRLCEYFPFYRMWPDHFSSQPDYFMHNLCSIVYADSAMASASHPNSGPTVETPHQPLRFFSFPKRPFGCYESASSLLKYRQKYFFLRFTRTDQHFTPLQICRAPPGIAFCGALQWCATMEGILWND